MHRLTAFFLACSLWLGAAPAAAQDEFIHDQPKLGTKEYSDYMRRRMQRKPAAQRQPAQQQAPARGTKTTTTKSKNRQMGEERVDKALSPTELDLYEQIKGELTNRARGTQGQEPPLVKKHAERPTVDVEHRSVEQPPALLAAPKESKSTTNSKKKVNTPTSKQANNKQKTQEVKSVITTTWPPPNTTWPPPPNYRHDIKLDGMGFSDIGNYDDKDKYYDAMDKYDRAYKKQFTKWKKEYLNVWKKEYYKKIEPKRQARIDEIKKKLEESIKYRYTKAAMIPFQEIEFLIAKHRFFYFAELVEDDIYYYTWHLKKNKYEDYTPTYQDYIPKEWGISPEKIPIENVSHVEGMKKLEYNQLREEYCKQQIILRKMEAGQFGDSQFRKIVRTINPWESNVSEKCTDIPKAPRYPGLKNHGSGLDNYYPGLRDYYYGLRQEQK